VPKLVLHIGTEKTGSTALQVFLKRHEKALFAKGFIYPNIFQTVNAGELYLSAAPREFTDYLDAVLFRRNSEFRQKYTKRLSKELARLAALACDKTCILSSELLYSRMRDVQALRRLRSNLFAAFDDIHIVCYIRNQADLVLGLSMEAIKQGSYLPQIRSPKDHVLLDYSCDYKRGLLNWLEVFPGRVTVRRYERHSLVNGDVIDDFLCVIGQPDLACLSKPSDVNRSLTQDQIKILNCLNSKKLNREKNGFLVKSILASFSDKAVHGKLQPTEEIRRYCEEQYQSSNEWVRAMFFPDDQALWAQSVDAVDTQSLLPSPSMASMIDIIVIEQNRREVLLAQSISKFLGLRQLLSLSKSHCLSWLARLYEVLANAPSNVLMLRYRAFGSRLRYLLWSFQLSCDGQLIGHFPWIRKVKRT
jgi:hypothetical protein